MLGFTRGIILWRDFCSNKTVSFDVKVVSALFGFLPNCISDAFVETRLSSTAALQSSIH
jgi:hypothetical protein